MRLVSAFRAAFSGCHLTALLLVCSTAWAVDTTPPATVLKIGEPVSITDGTQRIANSGFEWSFDGWLPAGAVSRSTGQPHGGSYSAMIGDWSLVGGSGLQAALAPVPPDTPLTLVLWYRTSYSGVATGSSYSIRVFDYETGAAPEFAGHTGEVQGWQKLVVDLSTFSDRTVYLQCIINTSASGQSVLWIDDVHFTVGSDVWVLPATSFTRFAADFETLVNATLYSEDCEVFDLYTSPFSLVVPGMHTLCYKSRNSDMVWEPTARFPIGLETAPYPDPVIATALAQPNTTSLSATFSSPDPQSGVASYEYAIGTLPGLGDVVPLTTTTQSYVTESGLDLRVGRMYYWKVRAVSKLGTSSGFSISLGTRICQPCATFFEAKQLPDDRWVWLEQKVVSALFDDLSLLAVQEPDRSSGILVESSLTPPSVGNRTVVWGQTKTVSGQRRILMPRLPSSVSGTAPGPLYVSARQLGGSPVSELEPEIPGSEGCNNVGLLVCVCGRVTKIVGSTFYLDDGSGISDDGASAGIMVDCSEFGSPEVAVSQFVRVTGISGITVSGVRFVRELLVSNPADILTLRTPALYISGADHSTAHAFDMLLEAGGITTTLMSITNVESADLSGYCLIIIGYDTNTGDSWGTPAAVAKVMKSGKPIIGVERGGAAFLGTQGLTFGIANMTFSTGNRMQPMNLTSPIFSDPYPIEVSEITPLTITTSTSGSFGSVNLTTVPRDVEAFGHGVGASTHYMLARQAGRYTFWPFRSSASYFTTDGNRLFVNAAWYTIAR